MEDHMKLGNDIPNEFRKKLVERINSISSLFKLNYPLNPSCQYIYPPINQIIIQNIVNALISNERFYVQTLHLMNKMNLPCPFIPNAFTSQNILGGFQYDKNNTIVPMVVESSSESYESELESDDNEKINSRKRLNENKNLLETSKPKKAEDKVAFEKYGDDDNIEKQLQVNIEDVFEKSSDIQVTNKKLEQIKQIPDKKKFTKKENETKDANKGENENKFQIIESTTDHGFGKIVPLSKKPIEITTDITNKSSDEPETSSEFITKEELDRNRLDETKLNELSVFKNYEKGELNKRLYIKKSLKKVEESHLKYIYGWYVNFNDQNEKESFDIRLMTEGRMKGQAFITLPNENIANKALNETNGYMLLDKPLVVQFARSAKPKT